MSFHFMLSLLTLWISCCSNAVCVAVRDRQRTKMERDILADLDHPFIVRLHYGEFLLLDGSSVVVCHPR